MSKAHTQGKANAQVTGAQPCNVCTDGQDRTIANLRPADHDPKLTRKAIEEINRSNVLVRNAAKIALAEAMKAGIGLQKLRERLSLEAFRELLKRPTPGPIESEVNAYLRFAKAAGFQPEEMQADIKLPNLAPLLRELANAFELEPNSPDQDCNRGSSPLLGHSPDDVDHDAGEADSESKAQSAQTSDAELTEFLLKANPRLHMLVCMGELSLQDAVQQVNEQEM